jgi:fructose-1,6-bisphosphatase/inositol monophosphatase family enzyme
MVAAAEGLGCTWNGRPCRVSEARHLYDATVLTSSILRCQARSDAFDRLATRTKLQRTWGDAFGYALVATGRAEVMLDPAISVWDCAPMLPILREAGGFFGDWQGNETIHGPDAWGANAGVAAEVLDILRSENRRPTAD